LDCALKHGSATVETITQEPGSPTVGDASAPTYRGADRSHGQTRREWLWRLASGPHAIALADQAIVSGTSFLTLILIGRWTNPSQLGLYSIGISVLVSTLAVQYSLVSLPYTIQLHRPIGTPAEYAGMSLMQSGLLSSATTVVLAVTALSLSGWAAKPDTVAMTWALAAIVPFALLREFARRYAFSRLRMVEALMLDCVATAIQLAALFWLGSTGRMSPANACVAIGGACALSSMVWLYRSRAGFEIRGDQVQAAARRSWALGKWLLAGQVTVSLQGYVTYWLLALVMGSTATGVYAACMSIASVVNPLMTGMNNAIAPKAVLALEQGGHARLRRRAARDAVLLGAAMSLFCLVLAFYAEDAMRLLYRGKDFAGQGKTVTLLGLGLLASAVGFPASFGLASLERPQAIVWAGSIGVCVTVVLGLGLMSRWDLSGAACGFLAGSVIGSVGLWVAFLAIVRRGGPRPDRNGDAGFGHARNRSITLGAADDVGSTNALRAARQWLAGAS